MMARGASFATLDPEDVKFFLKQQQKCLADSQGSKEEGILQYIRVHVRMNVHAPWTAYYGQCVYACLHAEVVHSVLR